ARWAGDPHGTRLTLVLEHHAPAGARAHAVRDGAAEGARIELQRAEGDGLRLRRPLQRLEPGLLGHQAGRGKAVLAARPAGNVAAVGRLIPGHSRNTNGHRSTAPTAVASAR